MKGLKITSPRFIVLGIVLSLFISVLYWYYIEQEVNEFRLTFSVPSSEYEDYVNNINLFSYADQGYQLYYSPNYESIADSIQDQNIRRFELKEYNRGGVNRYVVRLLYFKSQLRMQFPDVIGDRYVGTSKPLDTSIGLGILTMILFLFTQLLTRLFLVKKAAGTSEQD